MDQTRLVVVGGLGSVWLERKFKAVFDPFLQNVVDVVAIVDVYDKDEIEDEQGLEDKLTFIEDNRLGKKIDPDVRDRLKKDLLSRRIRYHQIDINTDILDPTIFSDANAVDISSPNKFHYPQFKRAFWMDLDAIVVEKPSVYSLEEALMMKSWLSRNGSNGMKLKCAEHYSHYGCVSYIIDNFEWLVKSLGKVKKIECNIFENDSFNYERNQQIILLELSGGGIGLDTGIHPIAFIYYLGGILNYDDCEVRKFKASDPRIKDARFGETAMEVRVGIGRGSSDDHFSKNCFADIKVAKCCKEAEKYFKIGFENGEAFMDIKNRSLLIKGFEMVMKDANYPMDAFAMCMHDFCYCRNNGREPRTSYVSSLDIAESIFLINSLAKEIEPAKRERPQYNHY